MISLSEQFDTHIDRETCFNFVADFSSVREWDPQIVSCTRVSDGPIGIGSSFHLKAKLFGKILPMEYSIVESDSPSLVVLEGRGQNGFKAVDQISFIQTDQGTTVLCKADLSFSGSDSHLKPLFKAFLKRACNSAISGLSRCLEGNFAGTTKISCQAFPVQTAESIGDRVLLPGMLGFSKLGA